MSAVTRAHLVPFAIRAERRLETPRGLGIVTTLAAVAVALLISAVLIWLIGGDPVSAYAHILRASLGSVGVLSDTLVKVIASSTTSPRAMARPARTIVLIVWPM